MKAADHNEEVRRLILKVGIPLDETRERDLAFDLQFYRKTLWYLDKPSSYSELQLQDHLADIKKHASALLELLDFPDRDPEPPYPLPAYLTQSFFGVGRLGFTSEDELSASWPNLIAHLKEIVERCKDAKNARVPAMEGRFRELVIWDLADLFSKVYDKKATVSRSP